MKIFIGKKIEIKDSGGKIGPILVCNNNTNSYRFYLVPNEDTWTKSSETENNITLQVTEKEHNKDQERIVWGPKLQNGERWTKWEVHMLPDKDKTITLCPQSLQKNYNGFGVMVECRGNNLVYSWQNSQGTSKLFIRVEGGNAKEQAKFKLQNCTKNGDGTIKECLVKFIDGSSFEWGGFSSKIAFPVKNK